MAVEVGEFLAHLVQEPLVNLMLGVVFNLILGRNMSVKVQISFGLVNNHSRKSCSFHISKVVSI